MKHLTQFHENVRAIRAASGLGQKVIATELGISETAYNRLERGETTMTAEHKKKIAAALKKTEQEIESHHLSPQFFSVDQNGDITYAGCTINSSADSELVGVYKLAIKGIQSEIATKSAEYEKRIAEFEKRIAELEAANKRLEEEVIRLRP
jgi:transcriptional regulator with XRE-family HTH domain